MTDHDLDLLILQIADGKNSYNDLKSALPNMSDDTLRQIALPYTPNPGAVIQMENMPPKELRLEHVFSGKETFCLTTKGTNRAHLLIRQQSYDRKLNATLLLSAISTIIALISLIQSQIK